MDVLNRIVEAIVKKEGEAHEKSSAKAEKSKLLSKSI